MEPPSADQLLASAIHFLIQGEEKDARLMLLFCEAAFGPGEPFNDRFSIHLVGPRAATMPITGRKKMLAGKTPATHFGQLP